MGHSFVICMCVCGPSVSNRDLFSEAYSYCISEYDYSMIYIPFIYSIHILYLFHLDDYYMIKIHVFFKKHYTWLQLSELKESFKEYFRNCVRFYEQKKLFSLLVSTQKRHIQSIDCYSRKLPPRFPNGILTRIACYWCRHTFIRTRKLEKNNGITAMVTRR